MPINQKKSPSKSIIKKSVKNIHDKHAFTFDNISTQKKVNFFNAFETSYLFGKRTYLF